MQLFKKNGVLGIAIDMTEVRLVEFFQSKNSYTINAITQVEVAPGTMQGKSLAQPSLLTKAIIVGMEQLSVKTKVAITGIPDDFVLKKVINLNKNLSLYDIENHLHLMGEDYLGHPIKDLFIDFKILSSSLPESTQMTIQIIAGKRSEIEKRLLALQAAGLNIKAVDVESFAIARMLRLMAPEKTVIWISWQLTILQIIIVDKKGRILYQNEKSLLTDLSTSMLIKAIEQEIFYFSQTLPQQTFDHVFYSGNIYSTEFLSLLAHHLGTAVTLADPKFGGNLQCNPTSLPLHHFIKSCGLALWNYQ